MSNGSTRAGASFARERGAKVFSASISETHFTRARWTSAAVPGTLFVFSPPEGHSPNRRPLLTCDSAQRLRRPLRLFRRVSNVDVPFIINPQSLATRNSRHYRLGNLAVRGGIGCRQMCSLWAPFAAPAAPDCRPAHPQLLATRNYRRYRLGNPAVRGGTRCQQMR